MAVSNKAQVGVVNESTYGTPVVVSKFYDFKSESLKREQERMESASLRAQYRVISTDNWALGSINVSGDVEMEVRPKSHGFWWNHAIGGLVTSQPDAGGNPTVYKHTFTPGDLPTSFTLQVGRPDLSDTVRVFTYSGCRITDWTLSCAVNEFASMQMSVLGRDEDTVTALATASYPTGNKPLRFVEGTVTIAGTATDVKSANIQGANNLSDDRYFLGSALRKQPLENALREYTGTFETEFADLTQYNRFVNGTEAAVVLLFQGSTISTTYKYETKITMNVRFDGETPNLGGPEIVMQNVPFKVINDGTTSIKVEYQTTDATV
jgi:hypothetical protein